jgi:hypothetical protein
VKSYRVLGWVLLAVVAFVVISAVSWRALSSDAHRRANLTKTVVQNTVPTKLVPLSSVPVPRAGADIFNKDKKLVGHLYGYENRHDFPGKDPDGPAYAIHPLHAIDPIWVRPGKEANQYFLGR